MLFLCPPFAQLPVNTQSYSVTAPRAGTLHLHVSAKLAEAGDSFNQLATALAMQLTRMEAMRKTVETSIQTCIFLRNSL